MMKEPAINNQVVSASGQEADFDSGKEKTETTTARGISQAIEQVSSEEKMDPIVKADKVLELVGQLKKMNEEWLKLPECIKKIYLIEKKVDSGEELTKEDLRFLYEIDEPIRIPDADIDKETKDRIFDIICGRDWNKDLVYILNCKEDEIGSDQDNVSVAGYKKYHYGGLRFRRFYKISSADGIKFPDFVFGDVDLNYLTSTKGIRLPQHISGDLWFDSLASIEDLKFPEYVGGDINLHNLKSAKGLELSGVIKGSVYLTQLPESEKEELRKKYPQHDIK